MVYVLSTTISRTNKISGLLICIGGCKYKLRMSVPLRPNPETGFLESPSPHNFNPERNYFNSERKITFLHLFDEAIKEKKYPTIGQICFIVGISLKTLQSHIKLDKLFADEWEERRLRLMDMYTGKLADKANSKMGTLANLAMLRWLETGSWSPESRVNHVSDNNVSKSLITGLTSVVDAELVDNSGDNSGALPTPGSDGK